MRRPCLREDIQDMKPLEAVEYLLSEMDKMSEALTSGAVHPVDSWGIKMSRKQRGVMICLYDANGEARTFDQLEQAGALGATRGSRLAIRAIICRARKRLLPLGIRIYSHAEIGFRMERTTCGGQ